MVDSFSSRSTGGSRVQRVCMCLILEEEEGLLFDGEIGEGGIK